ncbi:MAG: toxin-antitoxin system HicB family antitoxin, partial [Mycobacterium sp.]
DDLRVDVRASAPAEPAPEPTAPEDADNVARISLRLSEALKAQIETAARGHAVSVNTWLLRAAAAVLAGAGSQNQGRFAAAPGATHHLTGWING